MGKVTKHLDVPILSRNNSIWPLIFFLGGLTYFVIINAPSAIEVQGEILSGCSEDITKRLGYLCSNTEDQRSPSTAIQIDQTSPDNKFIVLEGFPIIKSPEGATDLVKIEVEVTIYALDNENKPVATIQDRINQKFEFSCNGKNNECAPVAFSELTDIKYTRYLFITRFLNIEQLTSQNVEDFKLAIVTSNPNFQITVKYFKFTLFLLSVFAIVLYKHGQTQHPESSSSTEQNYVGYLGLLLVLLNQPFVSVDYSQTYLLYNVILASAQYAILIYFWLHILQKYSSQTLQIGGLAYLLAKGVALGSFAILVYYYQGLESDQILHPLTIPQSDANTGNNVYLIYLLVGVTGVWTALGMCKIMPRSNELNWRESSALTFTLCYVIYYLLFISTGNFQFINARGSKVILLHGITTLYTLILQVIYLPYDIVEELGDKPSNFERKEQKAKGYDNLDQSVEIAEIEKKSERGTHKQKTYDLDEENESDEDYV